MDRDAIATLGALSELYESNGNPGAVSSGIGDPGGVSYGCYQLATNAGTPARFVRFLESRYPGFHAALAGCTPGEADFGEAWKRLAAGEPDEFKAAQHAFIMAEYYEPVVQALDRDIVGLRPRTRSKALNDVIWSVAVQHGVQGAFRMIEKALAAPNLAILGDEEMILRIYAERGRKTWTGSLVYFKRSSRAVQKGVEKRFADELSDALAALRAEAQTRSPAPSPAMA